VRKGERDWLSWVVPRNGGQAGYGAAPGSGLFAGCYILRCKGAVGCEHDIIVLQPMGVFDLLRRNRRGSSGGLG